MAEPMDLTRSAAALFWAWVPPLALQGGIALLLAALADRLLPRRAAPELREAAWALALLPFLLPPALVSPLALAPVVAPDMAARLTEPLGADPASWALPAAGVWLLGVGLFLAMELRLQLRARGELVRRRLEPTEQQREAMARAATRLGLQARSALFRLPGAGSPFVLGAFRPVIYLPESVPPEAVEHVLLHELAHVARRDGLRQALARCLHALFWFHPLLPWARRRLAATAEAVCDARVARALGSEATRYRATLLAFYRQAAAIPTPAAGMGFLAPPTALRLRLEAIAGAGRPSSWHGRLAASLLIGVFAVALLPMAAAAERRSLEVAEWITRPPGCLRLRFLVMERLAREAQKAGAASQPER